MAHDNPKQTRRGGVLGSTAGIRPDVRYVGRASAPRRWRAAVTFLTCAALIVGAVLGWRPRPSRMFNPGHVTRAHANIEFDCAKCHDGDGRGGFLRTVSDNACMKCHDGSIHHPNQLVAAAGADPRSAAVRSAMAIADPDHPGGMRSASCVSCHVEHRGREALLSTDDATCTRCHDNLKLHSTRPGAIPPGNVRVTAFNLNDHPAFGHGLIVPGPASATLPAAAGEGETSAALMGIGPGRPRDPTPLKFNHLLHLAKYSYMQSNCAVCHSTDAPQVTEWPVPPAGLSSADPGFQPPPWAGEKDAAFFSAAATRPTTGPALPKPLSLAGSSDRKYMQPVNYDRSCIGCHRSDVGFEVKAPDVAGPGAPKGGNAKKLTKLLVELPHRPLAEVRSAAFAKLYAALNTPGLLYPHTDEGDEDSPRLTPEAWRAKTAESLYKALPPGPAPRWSVTGMQPWPATPAAADAPTTTPATGPATAPVGATISIDQLADVYTAYVASTSCIKCHQVEGTAPAYDAASQQYTPENLATVPTGMGPSPRRWYANSNFDHGAHRDMTCVACHAKLGGVANFANVVPAEEGERLKTAASDDAELLSPNMAWSVYQFSPVSAKDPTGPVSVTSQARSCAECHHPETADSRGAGSTCLTCHSFHDRTLERPPGMADKPAVAAK